MINVSRLNIVRTIRPPVLALTLALLAVLLAALPESPAARAQEFVAICHRTSQVQDAIVAKIRETRPGAACGNITRTELESIRELTVHGYSRSSIRVRDFATLGRLETLSIHKSATLTTIPADAFSGVPGVIHLDLRGNAIKFLDPDAFGYHPRLTTIDLSINQIEYLPDGLFRRLSTLETLRLNSNYLVTIRDNQFAGLSALTELDLADNMIDTRKRAIETAAYDDIPLLESLNLGGNHLAPVDRDDFRKLTNLTELRLNNTGITSLHENTFWDTTNLVTLDLSDNEISTLHEAIFDYLRNLEFLYLQDNRLGSGSLPHNVFANTVLLADLNLSGNGLSSLHRHQFLTTTGLQFLNLSDNNLTGLHHQIFSSLSTGGITALTRLYLHDNNISSLHQDIFDGLDQMCELTLQNNSLTTLHVDVFDETVCLGQLDLRDNRISSLPATVFDSVGDTMHELRLGGNRLSSLPSGLFDGLTSMETLDLSRNGLTTLTLSELDPFAGTLTYLDLSGNNFTTPPTNAALEAKLTAIEDYYVTTASPTGIIDSFTISGGGGNFRVPQRNSNFEIRYQADAPRGVDTLTINVTPRDSSAEVGRNPEADGAFRIERSGGDPYVLNDRDPNTPGIQIGAPLSRRNVVEFFVDGNHYVIDVYRTAPSSNALLENLELTDVTLRPAFHSDTLEYVGFADRLAQWTNVAAYGIDFGITTVHKLNGDIYDRGSIRVNNAVTEVITVEVTAEDGVTTRTYRVVMLPKVTLTVSPWSLEERDRSSATVHAFLNKPVDQDTTVRISIHGSLRANLSSANTVTIRAGRRFRDTSLPSVEISPVDNELIGNYPVRVSGTVLDNPDVYEPDDVFFTIIDDDIPIPDVPRNFRVTSAGGKTTFNWTNVDKPKFAHEVRYEIYVRNTGESDDDWVFLADTGSHEVNPPRIDESNNPVYLPHEGPLTEQRLPVGGTYEFAMRALSTVRTEGESGKTGSAVLGQLTAPITHTVNGPNQPLRVRAERTINFVQGPVKLTWQPPPLYPEQIPAPLMSVPSGNVDTSVVQYIISRAEEPADDGDSATPPDFGASYTNIDSVPGNVLTYTDTTASDTKGYFYRVFALSPDGSSDRSRYAYVFPTPGATEDSGPQTPGPLTGFTLVNSSDQSTLATLTDGLSVELDDPDGGTFGIRAEVDGATTIGSVRLELTGEKNESRTESIAPYSLYGDGGVNLIYGGSLPVGSYTLTATAYAERGQRGAKLGTLEISFTVTVAPAQNPLTGFSLVDASNQVVLASLTNGASVGLNDPSGGSYAIRANVIRGASIGSVRLELSGARTASRTENYAPYSLHGDGGANALYGGSLPVGSYTLTATAYENRGLGGNTLGTLEISFTITDN